MLVLLGVPWIFSAFAVIDASQDTRLQHLEAVFNVSELAVYLLTYRFLQCVVYFAQTSSSSTRQTKSQC